MASLITKLKQGKIPDYIDYVAQNEEIDRQILIEHIINGLVVVPVNNLHKDLKPIAIGSNTRIKINANIGTSPIRCDFDYEEQKAGTAIEYGADTLMDLSIAGDIAGFREKILEKFNITLGTVPIYEAMIGLNSPEELNIDIFLKIIKKQAHEKVDFMTIHSGLLMEHIPYVDKRVLGVVSRGGSILVKWMRYHNKQNFLYDHFDKILEIAKEYEITLSLGDGLRPGCTADANDEAQFGELKVLGELVSRCKDADVQVMIEGPGHVPIHLIKENIIKQKQLCSNAPFYVLGPLVMDYAPGYDHITAAIGGAMAAYYGADYLCYVTPAEHLRLPTIDDVKEGVIASKIAACAVDLSRNKANEIKRNKEISIARKNFDWTTQKQLCIDQNKFDLYLEKEKNVDKPPCSMCGKWCAVKE